MKRLQLFEFEDQSWFPAWIRRCMTRLINVMHRLIHSEDQITELVAPMIKQSGYTQIIDFGSGSGGPMPGVLEKLQSNFPDSRLMLTDLYPEQKTGIEDSAVEYYPESVDAANPPDSLKGIRTLICSFHHMPPDTAKAILKNAQDNEQPLCIYEMSDNSFPKLLWWIAFPINIITCLVITPMARPMTWYQLVFTYLVPIIPICFAWDGAVSNARTYTIADMETLLKDIKSPGYHWDMNVIPGKAKKIYVKGMPHAH